MQTEDKRIILNLNEHDASRLLNLIRREADRDNKIWLSYWQRLIHHVEMGIERANHDPIERTEHLDKATLDADNQILQKINTMLMAENTLLREFMQGHLEPELTTGDQIVRQLLTKDDQSLNNTQKKGLTALKRIIGRLSEMSKGVSYV